MDKLEKFTGIKVENIKPQVDRFVFPDGHGIIVLVHEPGTWSARSLCKLEGEQGLQERSIPVTKEFRRESCSPTPSSSGCGDDNSISRASRLHRSESERTFQRRHLQVLSIKLILRFGSFQLSLSKLDE